MVENYHVGGIMIGSWTDLSMLTDGSLPTSPAPGRCRWRSAWTRRVAESHGCRLSSAPPLGRVLAQTKTPDEVYQLALDRGRQMRGLGITIDFAPVVDVPIRATTR